MHPNSLALLIWNVLDVFRDAYEEKDYDYLEECLQAAKRRHRQRVGWRGRMTDDARIADCHDLLDDIESM